MQNYISANDGSRYARSKLLGYYIQRACTNRSLRRLAARAVVTGLTALHGKPMHRRSPDPASVDTLRLQGYARLGKLLSKRQCADMHAYLRHQEMIATRGSGGRFTVDALPPGAAMGNYPLATIVNCPHVMEIANHPDVLAMAARYLGYTPTITLMSLRWSFPSETADADVQHFHRDVEVGSIKLLVYLTDVDEGSGPHSYVAGSHHDRMPLRMQRYADADVDLRHGGGTVITGPAGTAVAIDARGIHKGTPPIHKPRLLLGIQYSLLPCLMYSYSPEAYRGPGRFDPYVNRLMLAGGSRQDSTLPMGADRTDGRFRRHADRGAGPTRP
jgi:hypothetical protein